jgi:hypothetical protein
MGTNEIYKYGVWLLIYQLRVYQFIWYKFIKVLLWMFSFNGINQWNLKTITSLNRMFENATNFNSNIGNWDVVT